jgi:Zn-dependent peptidase ImmA (M78 family)
MDARRVKSIESKAADLLKNANKFYPNFEIEEVIDALGIYRVETKLQSGVSGVSMIDSEKKIITVNEGQHPNRKRFTLAHELGHIVLEHDTELNISENPSEGAIFLFRNDRSATGSDWREVEANLFAAAILMPKELVDSALAGKFRVDEKDITELAEKFGVSTMAMSIRLSRLNYI